VTFSKVLARLGRGVLKKVAVEFFSTWGQSLNRSRRLAKWRGKIRLCGLSCNWRLAHACYATLLQRIPGRFQHSPHVLYIEQDSFENLSWKLMNLRNKMWNLVWTLCLSWYPPTEIISSRNSKDGPYSKAVFHNSFIPAAHVIIILKLETQVTLCSGDSSLEVLKKRCLLSHLDT
jgi:hypothetical protein